MREAEGGSKGHHPSIYIAAMPSNHGPYSLLVYLLGVQISTAGNRKQVSNTSPPPLYKNKVGELHAARDESHSGDNATTTPPFCWMSVPFNNGGFYFG